MADRTLVALPARVKRAVRRLGGLSRPNRRLARSIRRAELEGLQFAFYARLTAIVVVSLWLVWSVPWPRDVYYGAYAVGFFILGYVPYRLRRHPYAEAIKFGFIVFDVALVSAAILLPPPLPIGSDWPVQTRLRGQEFLYLLLLLAEAALTYSPIRVIWTGASILSVWSVGVYAIYARADTLRFFDLADGTMATSAGVLAAYLDPAFVGLTAWRTQLIVTVLFTVLISVTVWRSRNLLRSMVQAEVVRADLARYVSPDVADALAARADSGFGRPTTRIVAILFADIVGFTRLTETLPPERTFALLRSFQERSCSVVFRHGGTLDKYLGDGFMATFGSIEHQADAPASALACAFALLQEIERWNEKRSLSGGFPVTLSIGVHCGPVTVGNLGGARVEFAVVGDVVNVASRLEEITRDVGGSLAVSDMCIDAAGKPEWEGRFLHTREISLRGRNQSIVAHIA